MDSSAPVAAAHMLRALRELEQRHEALFGPNPDPVYALDAELRILSGNEALERRLGRRLAELRGRSLLDFVAAADRSRVRQHVERAARGEERCCEFAGVSADGGDFILSATTQALLVGGQVEGVYGTARDVTEQREAERALRESEERYRLLADHVQDMISLHDTEGVFLYASPSAYELLGHHPVELVGRSVYELVEPEDLTLLQAAHDSIMRRQGRAPASFRARHAGGTVRWYETTAHVVMREDRPWRIVAVTRDVTDRRAVEQRVQQAQKMEAVGRLAGGVAHDFNNILTVIGGQAELLLAQFPPGSPEQEGAEHIREAAARAAAMTNRLLTFSRGQAAEPKPTDLNAIILELHDMLTRLLREDIQLVTQLEPTLRWLRCDPSALEQILVNLVANARDAMPAGGRLLLRTRNARLRPGQHPQLAAGDYVQLVVSDTGAGMDPATAARAFEPFFATRPDGAGTGLGLATVYSLVRQAGGDVTVESQAGAGTTITLLFPALASVPAAAAEPKQQQQPAAGPTRLEGDETVLIAEDDAGVRALAVAALQRHGYRVMAAVDGMQALELYRTWAHVIDIVVTDVNMPELPGPELVRMMSDAGETVPVLFISGFTSQAVRIDENAPGRGFLAKPFTAVQLVAAVRRLLDG